MHSHTDWRLLPNNPDPADDLGYDLIDLDIFQTTVDGRSRLLVLPTDEDLLHENAFIIVDDSTVCDLDTRI